MLVLYSECIYSLYIKCWLVSISVLWEMKIIVIFKLRCFQQNTNLTSQYLHICGACHFFCVQSVYYKDSQLLRFSSALSQAGFTGKLRQKKKQYSGDSTVCIHTPWELQYTEQQRAPVYRGLVFHKDIWQKIVYSSAWLIVTAFITFLPANTHLI